ncbi:MAG: Gfo/Idh/MocA family oxidoreductase [Lentisphaerae bacterium]|nr:Gfo/Idh/MocA family oxidoreductase [Lentisphaerota bacterium]
MAREQVYQGADSVQARGRAGRRGAGRGRTVGIGLIGCGGMGRFVAKKVLDQDPRLQIRAIYDTDPRSVKTSLEQLCPGAVVHESAEALCAAPEVDWVMIASWNSFHKDHTLAAFAAGKHVFCQKPLATSVEDCLAMRRAWQRSGRMFNIGFSLRYSPHYRAIHRELRAGTIGDIVSLEFNEVLGFNHGGYIMGDWRRLTAHAGTHLLEKCCHDIDLVNWMVGARARRVASFGGLNFFTPDNVRHIRRLGRDKNGRRAYHTWGGLVGKNPFTADKDIVDNQVAIIEFDNDVRATFHTNCNGGIPERRMYINGTEGALRADVVSGVIEVARIGFGEAVRRVKVDSSGSHGGGDDVLAGELADSMLRGTVPAVGLDEGLASAFTCFGIDQAMEAGKVVDMAPYWRRVAGGRR